MSDAPDALPPHWTGAAIDPPRAGGPVAHAAILRAAPEDFVVDEQLGFAPDGDGPHLLLRVRKRGANTDWVARQLAATAGVRPMDVGFAGLKDRNAVTTQWFTVPRGRTSPADWTGRGGEGYEVIEAHAHRRKLPRGALETNRFELRLRELRSIDGAAPDRDDLERRLAFVATHGAPNYFGPQRFGRDLSNLRAWLGEPRRRPSEYALSAGRSLIFNAVLARRIGDGTWDSLLPGEIANLDGRGSVFAVTDVDAEAPRCAALDIHPTGPLWGRGGTSATGASGELEAATAAEFEPVATRLGELGLEPARRALRVAVRDLAWGFEDSATLRISFELRGGAFATAVLRELVAAE
jgi:tRNA pseudouridine13 synthase